MENNEQEQLVSMEVAARILGEDSLVGHLISGRLPQGKQIEQRLLG